MDANCPICFGIGWACDTIQTVRATLRRVAQVVAHIDSLEGTLSCAPSSSSSVAPCRKPDPGTTQVHPNCVPWDANSKEVAIKVSSEPTSAKNEVSQETLDQWQRKDNSRRAKTMGSYRAILVRLL
jgi:hypothetical protein